MTAEPEAFFVARGDGAFEPTAYTRGPWSPDYQHAGPSAALLGRALEVALPADTPMQLVRVTIDILRPVPIAPLRVQVHERHGGRQVRALEAELRDERDRIISRAHAVGVRRAQIDALSAPDSLPVVAPADSAPFDFSFFTAPVGYHRAMELRVAAGSPGFGPSAVWMRMRLPLVAGEPISPLARVLAAADSGNGVSVSLDVARYTFMNPDLTVSLARLPVGEWVCLDAVSRTSSAGIGLSDTRLLDERGVIGRGCQSLLVAER